MIIEMRNIVNGFELPVFRNCAGVAGFLRKSKVLYPLVDENRTAPILRLRR
jgi:hypothetical protein